MVRYSKLIPEMMMPTDTPQYIFKKPCKMKIPERSDWENVEGMFKPRDKVVYNDGSKMDSGSGIILHKSKI